MGGFGINTDGNTGGVTKNMAAIKEVHESILTRHDSEIYLLELMRKCVSNKLKADRDYCASIQNIITASNKINQSGNADSNAGVGSAVIGESWKSIMAELNNYVMLIRNNAQHVEKFTLTLLNNLYNEKRKARKYYYEQYARISAKLNNLIEELGRKKADYSKHLQFYRLMRSRFEEHYVKAGRGGRKLEDVRDKYQRACRRVHLVHNEYVLLVIEAGETQKDFSETLLPSLVQYQQSVLESFVTQWQEILSELTKKWSTSGADFQEIAARMEKAVEIIKPSQEYVEFSSKYKECRTDPLSTIEFDDSLVADSSGRLQAGQLVVDNLTVDWVRSKMTELDTRLKETQGSLNSNSFLENDSQSLICKLPLKELRCEEKNLTSQLEVIKKALADLGCEELPNGCEMDSGFENSSDIQTDVPPAKRASFSHIGPSVTTTATSAVLDLIRKPFRRKSSSIPNSPILGAKHALNGIGSTGTNTSGSIAPSSDTTFNSLLNGSSLSNTNLNVVLHGVSNIPDIITNQDFNFTNSNSSLGSSTRSLVEEDWFHGVLPREEVVRLLVKDGDFLVRETTRNDENQTVLSVAWDGHKHFIVQTTAENEFRFEGPSFCSIQELIMFQYQSGQPVTSRSGAILKTPIPRERWELNNDDVILLEKIGRGNFGDVYKAKLRTSQVDVAVKTCRVTVPEEQKRKFLQEGRILKQYDHPNVVKLIGICVQKQPIMIVMELVAGGSLLTFLRNNAMSLVIKQLLNMCRDAAAGMCYLENKNCIHRDLAARNCLIGKDNIVKISDFGMSREEEEYIVSDGMKQIPIKWTAPEALNFGKYTSLCDVWSYGVLSWEIFSRGGTPYAGLSNTKAREQIDTGYRMPPPDDTPEEMYRLMLKCWEYAPENRPHFDQIYKIVDRLIAQTR
uniref:non-specific protein-tyrosine kinase n=1 Tax=Cacopsylla melanoneura TaxID=428564 RepID=A0A8D8RSL3_9HEMI